MNDVMQQLSSLKSRVEAEGTVTEELDAQIAPLLESLSGATGNSYSDEYRRHKNLKYSASSSDADITSLVVELLHQCSSVDNPTVSEVPPINPGLESSNISAQLKGSEDQIDINELDRDSPSKAVQNSYNPPPSLQLNNSPKKEGSWLVSWARKFVAGKAYQWIFSGIGVAIFIPFLHFFLNVGPSVDEVALYDVRGRLYIDAGENSGVRTGDTFMALGETIGGTESRESIALLRVMSTQAEASEVEVLDVHSEFRNDLAGRKARIYEPGGRLGHLGYGQIIEYDGSIAKIDLGTRHGVSSSGSFDVLGAPVQDLSLQSKTLGREQIAVFVVEDVFESYSTARPIDGSGLPVKVGDFVLYSPTKKSSPSSGNQEASLQAFAKYGETERSTLSFGTGLFDLRYGYDTVYLEAGFANPLAIGHLVNLGSEVSFEAIKVNTDRTRGGSIFQGISRDETMFIKHTFALLGRPDDVNKARGILSGRVTVKTKDVLLVRSLFYGSGSEFVDQLAKLEVLEHKPGDSMRLRWELIYRRGPDSIDPSSFNQQSVLIVGTIVDDRQQALSGVTVVIRDGKGNEVSSSQTGLGGKFEASIPAVSTVQVEFLKSGYRTSSLELVVDGKRADVGTVELRKTEKLGGLEVLGRNIVFVIDTSGSMSDVLVDLRLELTKVLRTMSHDQRFTIIQFNNKASAWRQHLELPSHSALDEASRYISQLTANGGTNLGAALRLVESLPFVDTIYVLSDGAFDSSVLQREAGRLAAVFGEELTVNTWHFGDAGGAAALRALDAESRGRHAVYGAEAVR